MFFFQDKERFISAYKVLVRYNESLPPAEKIKFLHGGSSAVFAYMGRKIVKVQQSRSIHEGEKTVIPQALIPTGILRKQYGLYPFSGELEVGAFAYGSRKYAFNYHHLSGMDLSLESLVTTFAFAKQHVRFLDAKLSKERIERFIKCMDITNYVLHLKILSMELQNLIILFPDEKPSVTQALILLENQRKALVANYGNQVHTLKKYFDKYQRLLHHLNTHEEWLLTFDDHFRKNIKQQYPIIFCSTVRGTGSIGGVPDEQLFAGNISFDSIKFLITEAPYVERLKSTLKEQCLEQVMVLGLDFKNDKNTIVNDSVRASAFL